MNALHSPADPERFDPYHLWLGIPPHKQPPDHYALLGLEPFETNPAVIENAADQRMAHLRSRQTGPHGVLSQRLLNEVAAARLCLLQPDRKAAYDEQVSRGLPGKAAAEFEPFAPADSGPWPTLGGAGALVAARNHRRRRTRRRFAAAIVQLAAWAVVGLLGLVAYWVAPWRETAGTAGPYATAPEPPDALAAPPSGTPPPAPTVRPPHRVASEGPIPQGESNPPASAPAGSPAHVATSGAAARPDSTPDGDARPAFPWEPEWQPPVADTPVAGGQDTSEDAASARRDVAAETDRFPLEEPSDLPPTGPVRRAHETLRGDRHDVAANGLVGRWFGFQRADWDRALEYLARGDDDALRSLAGRELRSPPATPQEMLELADAWWAAAQGRPRAEREAMLVRAGHWYDLCGWEWTRGAERARIENRLQEISRLHPRVARDVWRAGSPRQADTGSLWNEAFKHGGHIDE